MSEKRNNKDKKYFMIDLDGTIYHRSTALPYAKEFIALLKEKEYPYVFFTNSPEFSKKELAQKLQKMGIDCEKNDFLSTADVCLEYLMQKHTSCREKIKVFVLGSAAFKQLFVDAGFILVENTAIQADYVFIGYDKSINLEQCENACTHIFNGAKAILTNRDHTIPSEKGFVPHTGAISALIEFATKVKALDMGKPDIYALEAVLKHFSCTADRLCIVGDNLETDIALGEKFNISSCLLLTGLTRPEMLVSYGKKDFLKVFENLEALCKSL